MRMKRSVSFFASIYLAGLAIVIPVAWAEAQSMTPMRGEIGSYSEEFALRVHPRNPYKHRIRIEMRAYDQDFRPIDAFFQPAIFQLGAGNARTVLALLNFGGEKERKVRICAESVPVAGRQSQIKVRICGKFVARQLR